MVDDSFWEEVERSRRMTEQQRFRGTLEMIDLSRGLNISGIRHRHPDADDAQVREILLKQHRILREVEAIP